MAPTLSIRLRASERETLEQAARDRGIGLSAFVRELAEAEARRLVRDQAHAEGLRVTTYLASHPDAAEELDDYGTPIGDEG